jgi:hypothetical protein
VQINAWPKPHEIPFWQLIEDFGNIIIRIQAFVNNLDFMKKGATIS